MKRYVMFGQSSRFGDYADTMHACGGMLARLILNVGDEASCGQKSIRVRLAEYEAWRLGKGIAEPVEVANLADFAPAKNDDAYVMGFGGLPQITMAAYLKRKFGLRFEALVHPAATVAASASIGEGTVIMAGVVIGSFAAVGDFVYINRGATIGHDCRVDRCCNIGPGAHLASSVHMHEAAVVGLGANVIEHLVLGTQCFVAAGAVLLKNAAPGELLAGVPATVKKQRQLRVIPESLPGMVP